jgi:hypothetical protein
MTASLQSDKLQGVGNVVRQLTLAGLTSLAVGIEREWSAARGLVI